MWKGHKMFLVNSYLKKKIKRRLVIFCRAFFSFVILCFYFYPFNKRSFIEKHVHEYEKMCVLIYEFVHYLIYYFSKCWKNWKGIGLGLVGSPETTFFKCKKSTNIVKKLNRKNNRLHKMFVLFLFTFNKQEPYLLTGF